MKVGLVTYTPKKVEGFDKHVYYAKWADGSKFPAAKEMNNDITCFCDAKAIRENPNIVAISRNGPALRKNRRLNLPFDFVCPTDQHYQNKVLKYIEETSEEKIEGITLNLYHFPEEEFCVCPRCVDLWRQSGLNWYDWRAQTIIDFVKEAKKAVKGQFAVEIWPDPVLAKERFGIDLEEIAEHIDYFHVPLSARDYTTMYWVDTLTRDFVNILEKPIVIELSAEMLNEEKTEALLKTMAYISRYDLQGMLLLVHNSENAREICRFAVSNSDLREWFDEHEFNEMSRLIDYWTRFY